MHSTLESCTTCNVFEPTEHHRHVQVALEHLLGSLTTVTVTICNEPGNA